jgi:hypothetical protein
MDGGLETEVVDTRSFFMANRWCFFPFDDTQKEASVINDEERINDSA